jgi:hypothetical protein
MDGTQAKQYVCTFAVDDEPHDAAEPCHGLAHVVSQLLPDYPPEPREDMYKEHRLWRDTAITQLYQLGEHTQTQLGELFRLSQNRVSEILSGKANYFLNKRTGAAPLLPVGAMLELGHLVGLTRSATHLPANISGTIQPIFNKLFAHFNPQKTPPLVTNKWIRANQIYFPDDLALTYHPAHASKPQHVNSITTHELIAYFVHLRFLFNQYRPRDCPPDSFPAHHVFTLDEKNLTTKKASGTGTYVEGHSTSVCILSEFDKHLTVYEFVNSLGECRVGFIMETSSSAIAPQSAPGNVDALIMGNPMASMRGDQQGIHDTWYSAAVDILKFVETEYNKNKKAADPTRAAKLEGLIKDLLAQNPDAVVNDFPVFDFVLMDNAKVHFDLATSELLRKNAIYPVYLPPNTTPFLAPLDTKYLHANVDQAFHRVMDLLQRGKEERVKPENNLQVIANSVLSVMKNILYTAEAFKAVGFHVDIEKCFVRMSQADQDSFVKLTKGNGHVREHHDDADLRSNAHLALLHLASEGLIDHNVVDYMGHGYVDLVQELRSQAGTAPSELGTRKRVVKRVDKASNILPPAPRGGMVRGSAVMDGSDVMELQAIAGAKYSKTLATKKKRKITLALHALFESKLESFGVLREWESQPKKKFPRSMTEANYSEKATEWARAHGAAAAAAVVQALPPGAGPSALPPPVLPVVAPVVPKPIPKLPEPIHASAAAAVPPARPVALPPAKPLAKVGEVLTKRASAANEPNGKRRHVAKDISEGGVYQV